MKRSKVKFIFNNLLLIICITGLISCTSSNAGGKQPFLAVDGLNHTSASSATWSRNQEPVILTGAQIPAFIGVDISTGGIELFGYALQSGVWNQIPIQVDEVNSSGEYGVEDGLLDANDELVFMAKDYGNLAPPYVWINDLDSENYLRYQINVVNPLDTSEQGWVYIYRSSTLTPSPIDYVSWNGSTNRITGEEYVLGLDTTNFVGINYLELNNTGVNIVDRLKLRANITCNFFITLNLTEENIPVSIDLTPDVDGPIRVGGGTDAGKLWAYNSLYWIDAVLDIDNFDVSSICPLQFSLNEVRVSFDWLDPDISGMAPAIYYDPNTTTGVSIDGVPDSIAATPSNSWMQITGQRGSIVQVVGLALGGGTVTNYYKDDSSTDNNDTGDLKSFGDSGFKATDPSGVLDLQLSGYVLPASQPNLGSVYKGYQDNPIQVNLTSQMKEIPIFIPVTFK